jgi:hypothetical protein
VVVSIVHIFKVNANLTKWLRTFNYF